MKELNIYDVNLKYIRDLHKSDSNVMSQSPQVNKNTRCYIGIIIMVNGQHYCIPFSSGNKTKFQNKKSNIDMIKVYDDSKKNNDGTFKLLSVLNINNMIPVSEKVISKVNLNISNSDSTPEKMQKILLQKELKWCRNNFDLIERRARKVYDQVINSPDKNRNLVRRCCDFKKLEEVLQKKLEKEQNTDKTVPFRETVSSMEQWAEQIDVRASEQDRHDIDHGSER